MGHYRDPANTLQAACGAILPCTVAGGRRGLKEAEEMSTCLEVVRRNNLERCLQVVGGAGRRERENEGRRVRNRAR